MNDPARLLSIFLGGALGRSGRKRAGRAASFIGGHKGFMTASTLLSAAGVAWGIYDSLQENQSVAGPTGAIGAMSTAGVPGVAGVSTPPPLPAATAAVPDEVLRIVRLAVSAANADGSLAPNERALILAKARETGVEGSVESELSRPHALSEIVRGISDPAQKKDLYVLAFTIVRADEAVSGAERIYLAQLAHQLGMDPALVAELEQATSNRIDAIEP